MDISLCGNYCSKSDIINSSVFVALEWLLDLITVVSIFIVLAVAFFINDKHHL